MIGRSPVVLIQSQFRCKSFRYKSKSFRYTCKVVSFSWILVWEIWLNEHIGAIYTRDGSSVCEELGQRTIVRLIIRLRINTGKQTNDPFRRISTGNSSMDTNYPHSSSGRMIRLFARIYTRTNYQTNYRSLPKFVPDGWSVSSINRAIESFFPAELFLAHGFEKHNNVNVFEIRENNKKILLQI